MRTIKFRGKRYGDGAWIYGNLYQGTKEGEQYSIILDDAGYDLAPKDDRNLAIAFAENEVNVVFPDSVGQFTGLHDKNGKEIYEGDIVDAWSAGTHLHNGIIKWGKGIAGFFIMPPKCNVVWHLAGNDENKETLEVIGNIHDNPELMKQNE